MLEITLKKSLSGDERGDVAGDESLQILLVGCPAPGGETIWVLLKWRVEAGAETLQIRLEGVADTGGIRGALFR
jgi:hypothetical protein